MAWSFLQIRKEVVVMSPEAENFSMGVEEEYQIIDQNTRELAPSAEPILLEAQQTLGDDVQFEIHLSQLEVVTPVCRTLAEVRREIKRLRRGAIAAAALHGRYIAAAGTHPFSQWKEQIFTPQDRYLALEHLYQQLAREQAIFGCHVHVGINDRKVALQVMNHARIWLSPLIALSGSSPFWQGTDTGYVSYRMPHWNRWPFSGPPQVFDSLDAYNALLDTLLATKSIDDRTKVYWDMRLSERYPTIEIRVTDVCMTIDETIMFTGLVRALIRTCYEQVMRGDTYLPVRQEVLRAAHWEAARYGLNGDLVDMRAGRSLPGRQIIEQFREYLRPALEAHGDWEEVSTILTTVMQHGTGAERQRAIYQQTGRLTDVVDFIVGETARDTEAV
jgi:glutamate---cysteine ligase / carboxylate-amine ligase